MRSVSFFVRSAGQHCSVRVVESVRFSTTTGTPDFAKLATGIRNKARRFDEVGLALGAQVGEARWREIILGAGFKSFRRAAETPFNRVLEARP